MRDELKTLIFLGPQGSGKGTQAKLLAEKYGYEILGAGDMLRQIAKQDTELGKKVHQTINIEGKLVEPEIISQVFKDKLLDIDPDQPVILDSYPRSPKQYEMMKEFWSETGRNDYWTLYFDITDEESMKRLTLRAENEGRDDDTPEKIKRRLKWSKSQVDPMVEQMKKESKVIYIDGMPAIEEIHKQVLKKLGLNED